MSARMKALRNRGDIESVTENDEYLYMGFRPSSKDLLNIVKTAPNLKVIYVPKSYFKTLSKSMVMMLDMKEIQVKAEGVQNNEKIRSCYILDDEPISELDVQDTPEDQTQDKIEEGNKEETNTEYGNVISPGENETPSGE